MAIEETMAQLAHSQVSQSLPSLLDDVQGFQIIDHNEENNSAVGVLVALIGTMVVYIPAVYRKGKIYNLDIMYIPQLHQWLPAQDNWITYLRSRKTELEATIVDEHADGKRRVGGVDLDIPLLKIVKTASEPDSKFIEREGVPALLKLASDTLVEELTRECSLPHIMSTPELLKKCAASAEAQRIVNTIAQLPSVADAFVQYYGDDELTEVGDIVVHALTTEQKKPDTKGSVRVLTSASSEAKDLSDLEKAIIVRDGAVIVDDRGYTPTKIYKTKSNANWASPSTNGVYELLKLDGSTLTALVIVGPHRPFNNSGIPAGHNFIVPLDDGLPREMLRVPGEILGQEMPLKEFTVTGGYSFDTIPTDYPGEYMIVDIDGSALQLSGFKPMYVGSGDSRSIRTNCYVQLPNYDTDQYNYFSNARPVYNAGPRGRVTELVPIPAGGKLRVKGTTIFVPEKCRIFKLGDYLTPPQHVGSDEYLVTEPKESIVGKLATMDEYIDAVSRREKLLSVKVFNSDGQITISDVSGKATDPLSKLAAEKELVTNYFLTPADAHNIVYETKTNSQQRYLFKIDAENNYMMSFEEVGPAEHYEANTTDLSSLLGKDDIAVLEDAAKTGVKEVVDVTVLKLLAEDGSSVRMVQDLIPALFSAMNSVGQLLFMLRAGISMTEAYGEYRADEMEKQFAKLMQRLGDAVIVLQQGRIDEIKDLLEGPLASTLG